MNMYSWVHTDTNDWIYKWMGENGDISLEENFQIIPFTPRNKTMHPHPRSVAYAQGCCLGAKSCPTVCDLMDCSPPGSSVHSIFQARTLEWVAISFSMGFPTRESNLRLLHLLPWQAEPSGKPIVTAFQRIQYAKAEGEGKNIWQAKSDKHFLR